jgi:hypothetical protein
VERTRAHGTHNLNRKDIWKEHVMGRSILLWLIGIPIPIIILIALLSR